MLGITDYPQITLSYPHQRGGSARPYRISPHPPHVQEPPGSISPGPRGSLVQECTQSGAAATSLFRWHWLTDESACARALSCASMGEL